MKENKINVLVTGGAGHIGSTLSIELAKIPYFKVTVVDNLLTGSLSNLSDHSEKVNFIEGDINDDNIYTFFSTQGYDNIRGEETFSDTVFSTSYGFKPKIGTTLWPSN